MPSPADPAPTPLDPLFKQILGRSVREHLTSYWTRRRSGVEGMVEFLERFHAVGKMNLSVLKLVARDFISLDEARALLVRERFAEQIGSFLRAAEPGWQRQGDADEDEGFAVDESSETILRGREASEPVEEPPLPTPSPLAMDSPPAAFRRSWVDEGADGDGYGSPASQAQVFRRSWADDVDDYEADSSALRIDPVPSAGQGPSGYAVDDVLPGYEASDANDLGFRAPPLSVDAPLPVGPGGPSSGSSQSVDPAQLHFDPKHDSDSVEARAADADSTVKPPLDRPTKKLTAPLASQEESTTSRIPPSSRPAESTAKPQPAPPPAAPPPVAAGAADTGERMGKYVLEKLIGQGGFGAVYASNHPLLRVPVAVKVMRSDLVQGEDKATFLSEARLVAQLNHPAIVRVWDFDEDAKGRPYLVLEYVDGATLSDLLRQKGGKLPPAAAIGIARDVAQGLQAASRLGIVHKDVKPANILISRDGAVKLTDFGVASLTDRRLGSLLSIHGNQDHMVSGTVDYMPPEQAQGDVVDARADMYALGVTLYQAITGKLPFVGTTTAQVLLRQMCDDPVPPSQLVPNLPTAVSNTILKMMARSPEDRYKNYADLITALDAAAAVLAAPAAPSAWSAEAQAAAPPPPPDAETSGSVWNWLKRGARWIIKR